MGDLSTMLNTLFAAATLASGPATLDAKPISASLFKNGFAVVTREAKLGPSGAYLLDVLPQAVLGTFWITASRGVKLNEVVVGNEATETVRPVASIDEILQANIGHKLDFRLADNRAEQGTLLSVNGNICVIERILPGGKKQMWAVPKNAISEIFSDSELIYTLKTPGTKRVLRLQAETPGSGSVYFVTLERGASWAPSYSVDISDPKILKLVAKATIIDDTLDLNRIEVRLVTGFPNIPLIRWMDPFTSGQSLLDFTNSLMGMGTPADMRRAGGFGGGLGGQLSQNRLAERDFDAAFQTSTLPGLTAEDLFFYRQPNVSLKPGDRGYYVLFSAQSEYRHVYEWDIPDQIRETQYVGRTPEEPNDVWHSLKFKNTSKQPFTTAGAIVMKDGEILGQDIMSYTSAEAEATVRITKALDVRADDAEEEISREREFLKIRSGNYDLVTLKGTLEITNRKSETVTLEITKDLTGELKSADDNPKVTSIAKGLRAVNPRQRLQWKIEVKPGEKKTIGYTYTVFIA